MSNEDTNRNTPGTCTGAFRSSTGVESVSSHGTTAEYLRRKVVGTGPRVKPKGWLFPTSYLMLQTRTTYPNGWALTKNSDGSQYVWRGTLSPTVHKNFDMRVDLAGDSLAQVNVDLVSQAEAKALTKFLTHGNDRDGTWNPGIAWGERKETAKMLASGVQRLFSMAQALRRGDWRFANNFAPAALRKEWNAIKDTPYGRWLSQRQSRAIMATPEALASGIVEFQNGWMPLYNDVRNAAEALANRNQLADWVITAIGKYHSETIDRRVLRDDTAFVARCKASRDVRCVKAVKVRLDATVGQQHLHRVAQLGMNNPASTFWQLIPGSYIVDHYVAIGTWLASLGAVDGMKFYSGSMTKYYEMFAEITSADKATGAFYGSNRIVEMQRTPYNGFPIPIAPLSMRPKELSMGQIFNQLSVLYLWMTGKPIDLRQ